MAQACVHEANYKDVLLTAEANANEIYGTKGEKGKMPPILSLYEELRDNKRIVDSIRMSDDNKVRDGVLSRASEEMLRMISKVKVNPEEIEEKTAEMFDTSLYAAASASFHPGKPNKFDFFLMCVTL